MDENIKWVETPMSGNIRRIGYDEPKMDFYVEFITGKIYLYASVPKEVWISAQGVPSIGRFVNENIKGKYNFKNIN